MHKLIEAKAFGFWKNTSDKYPDIADFIRPDKMKNAAEVAQYLNNGSVIVASPGMTKCFLCGENIGSQSIETDGIWAWPSTLPHFILKHKVHLPGAFLESIEKNNFIMPAVDDAMIGNVDENLGKAFRSL